MPRSKNISASQLASSLERTLSPEQLEALKNTLKKLLQLTLELKYLQALEATPLSRIEAAQTIRIILEKINLELASYEHKLENYLEVFSRAFRKAVHKDFYSFDSEEVFSYLKEQLEQKKTQLKNEQVDVISKLGIMPDFVQTSETKNAVIAILKIGTSNVAMFNFSIDALSELYYLISGKKKQNSEYGLARSLLTGALSVAELYYLGWEDTLYNTAVNFGLTALAAATHYLASWVTSPDISEVEQESKVQNALVYYVNRTLQELAQIGIREGVIDRRTLARAIARGFSKETAERLFAHYRNDLPVLSSAIGLASASIAEYGAKCVMSLATNSESDPAITTAETKQILTSPLAVNLTDSEMKVFSNGGLTHTIDERDVFNNEGLRALFFNSMRMAQQERIDSGQEHLCVQIMRQAISRFEKNINPPSIKHDFLESLPQVNQMITDLFYGQPILIKSDALIQAQKLQSYLIQAHSKSASNKQTQLALDFSATMLQLLISRVIGFFPNEPYTLENIMKRLSHAKPRKRIMAVELLEPTMYQEWMNQEFLRNKSSWFTNLPILTEDLNLLDIQGQYTSELHITHGELALIKRVKVPQLTVRFNPNQSKLLSPETRAQFYSPYWVKELAQEYLTPLQQMIGILPAPAVSTSSGVSEKNLSEDSIQVEYKALTKKTLSTTTTARINHSPKKQVAPIAPKRISERTHFHDEFLKLQERHSCYKEQGCLSLNKKENRKLKKLLGTTSETVLNWSRKNVANQLTLLKNLINRLAPKVLDAVVGDAPIAPEPVNEPVVQATQQELIPIDKAISDAAEVADHDSQEMPSEPEAVTSVIKPSPVARATFQGDKWATRRFYAETLPSNRNWQSEVIANLQVNEGIAIVRIQSLSEQPPTPMDEFRGYTQQEKNNLVLTYAFALFRAFVLLEPAKIFQPLRDQFLHSMPLVFFPPEDMKIETQSIILQSFYRMLLDLNYLFSKLTGDTSNTQKMKFIKESYNLCKEKFERLNQHIDHIGMRVFGKNKKLTLSYRNHVLREALPYFYDTTINAEVRAMAAIVCSRLSFSYPNKSTKGSAFTHIKGMLSAIKLKLNQLAHEPNGQEIFTSFNLLPEKIIQYKKQFNDLCRQTPINPFQDKAIIREWSIKVRMYLQKIPESNLWCVLNANNLSLEAVNRYILKRKHRQTPIVILLQDESNQTLNIIQFTLHEYMESFDPNKPETLNLNIFKYNQLDVECIQVVIKQVLSIPFKIMCIDPNDPETPSINLGIQTPEVQPCDDITEWLSCVFQKTPPTETAPTSLARLFERHGAFAASTQAPAETATTCSAQNLELTLLS